MCLYSNLKYPHTADEDIIVYKILDENLRSPYQDFQYELNKEYINEDKKEIIDDFYIAVGSGYFHAFRTLKLAIERIKYICAWKKIKFKIFKAIIPKDSQYYINLHNEEICGDRIKIIEEIKVK